MLPASEKLVFFDLESAGLKKAAAIIQIAAVAVDSQLRQLESFECKIRFDSGKAAKQALSVNSFEPTVWKRLATKPKDAAHSFASFLRRHATVDMISKEGKVYQVAQLVAHHAAFDGPMIESWYARQRVFLPASRRVFCTLQRAMWLFHEIYALTPPADYKLGTLCQYFGIPLRADEAHDALADVRATAELYRALLTAHLMQAREAA